MRFLLVPALMAFAAPAYAAGDNVVMVSVAHVYVPPDLPGLCRVDGTIRHVWQGHAFHEGQALSLTVPCGTHRNAMPLPPATLINGPRLTDPAVLSASTLGAAHLDDAGNLMWQTPTGSPRIFWGYRVLQSVPLHLGRTA